ncbi:hypothetical protein HMPREF0658_1805 [Hoylesella marshii DSM 16973 = JCM 13450]|uniref:Uncharacterized protein n=1 Tax=Hoylesella marshii DSM 16973 = JCM 13450 TaxID=862515 RepID=E0NUF2_9BACT|nr:hypothetical protein HMPREF0658_1805 [Hoylesella marshii DSM 16973 = JCM 13450]
MCPRKTFLFFMSDTAQMSDDRKPCHPYKRAVEQVNDRWH